jgi:hypothetical protein
MLTYDNTIDYDRKPDDNGIFVFFPTNEVNTAVDFVHKTGIRMNYALACDTVRSWAVDGGFNIPAIWKS